MQTQDPSEPIQYPLPLPQPMQNALVIPPQQCQLPWMKEYAKQLLENALIKGDIASFYDKWSDVSKTFMTFSDLGRNFAIQTQLHGPFTRIGDVSEPQLLKTGFWLMRVQLFVNDIDFFSMVSISPEKAVGDFMFARCCIYHAPSYIKHSRYIREIISDSDPRIILSKPTTVAKFPCALFVHTLIDQNADLRIGYTFPALDLEYLPSANIGLLRSDFSELMIQSGNPIIAHVSKLMEVALGRDDISKVFLILHGYSSNLMNAILRKFPNIVSGVILISPSWCAPEGSPLPPMTVEALPKNMPMIVLQGGYDIVNKKGDFALWEGAMKSIGGEAIMYNSLDYFLFACPQQPTPQEYSMFERHMSDVPLRQIAQWIRSHSE